MKLEDIRPKREDAIKARLQRSISFCRVTLWMMIQFEAKEEIIYTTDVKKFLGVSIQRAYAVLRDFCDFGLLRQIKINDSFSEFVPVKSGNGVILLKKYAKLAKRRVKP